MDEAVKAGRVTSVLGAVILLGVLTIAAHGAPYVWLAVLVFGFVAAGLIGMGLYSIAQRARQSVT